ncbi:MAG: hypothetical protein SVU69_13725, partial [Pseudomonadota bacterium]|nr:hypothetical protein [Pseudomonadota bacterium]
MKTQTKKIITGLAAIGVTLLCGLPAHADDTEIYVTPLPASAQPNVLFIVDTSGSMGTMETITTPYDTATTYTGSCDPSRIYWSTSGSPPSCSTSRYFPLAANRCDAAVTPLATTGFYIAEVAQWRRGIFSTRKWRDLSSSYHGTDEVVECKADEGVHGPDSSSSDVYADRRARNSDDRWTSDSGDKYYGWNQVTFYDANYMNYYHSGVASIDRSRLWIVQDISKKLVASLNGVNIGLMRFDEDGSGGYVALHVDDIATNRSAFNTTIDGFEDDGNTPLSETLYEAALYWRGETPEYGLSSDPDQSVANSMSGGKYISPILDVCQKNNIVYLTDGEPTNDTGANSEIETLMGASCQANAGVSTGYCLDDLAQWLYENDQIDVDGTETVI